MPRRLGRAAHRQRRGRGRGCGGDKLRGRVRCLARVLVAVAAGLSSPSPPHLSLSFVDRSCSQEHASPLLENDARISAPANPPFSSLLPPQYRCAFYGNYAVYMRLSAFASDAWLRQFLPAAAFASAAATPLPRPTFSPPLGSAVCTYAYMQAPTRPDPFAPDAPAKQFVVSCGAFPVSAVLSADFTTAAVPCGTAGGLLAAPAAGTVAAASPCGAKNAAAAAAVGKACLGRAFCGVLAPPALPLGCPATAKFRVVVQCGILPPPPPEPAAPGLPPGSAANAQSSAANETGPMN